MTADAEKRQPDGEAVEEDKECLERDDGVAEAGEEFLCYHCVLFD